jgi:hypothetical protein
MAPAPVVFASDKPVRQATLVPTRKSLPAREARLAFFVSFVGPRAATAGLTAPARAAPAASVALFKAHCCFLI